tara:strand:- start:956 stop:2692 length:1737 start_codon:yes stop_codon:yes gene_type:complete
MKKNIVLLSLSIALGLLPALPASAQTITSSSKMEITIAKGQKASTLKRELKAKLEARVVRNLLETSFAIKITPEVDAQIPGIVELLTDSIEISIDPLDGEVLSGTASISFPSAKLKEILTNKGIGAGDIAAKSAKILVSIDEFVGVATNNDGQTATSTEVSYTHDKSTFSDTSAKASASNSASSASSASVKKDVEFSDKRATAVAASRSTAVAGKESSAVAARQDTAVAGRSSEGYAVQNRDGSAASGRSSEFAGSQSTQVASARKSEYAAAQKESYAASAASDTKFKDKSEASASLSASSASSFKSEQNNVQQKNDKVSYSVKTKMPEFNNAKPLGGQDRVLASRLSGEFQNNGLRLVAENDLRAEGGRILPMFEITNNGRIDQFIELIQRKNINADVWATGQANYTIVGTTSMGTECNGNLSVQGRFIDGNEIFFEDSLQAAATGNGDQDCRGRLGIALASSLAMILGERANKELNARASRGGVYEIFLYSLNGVKRSDRRGFEKLLSSIPGLKAGEPKTTREYMSVSVQFAGKLKNAIDDVLDQLPWDNAEVMGPKANKICVGIEGFNACPREFN